MMLKRSFAPIISKDATILVLGSMPGEVSLKMGQYYAHPQNLFWKILGRQAGKDLSSDYSLKIDQLFKSKVALWDVLKFCERVGSLDVNIKKDTEEPNDIVGLLEGLGSIRKICFNGQKAYSAFKKHILKLRPDFKEKYELVVLPSTSPANASISSEEKYRKWMAEVWGSESLWREND